MASKADAELFVDLRLALRKLKEDIREASKMIKDGLGQSLNVGDAQERSMDKKAVAQERLANKVKRTTSALKEQLEAWKKANAGGVAPGMRILDVSRGTATTRTYGPGQVVSMTGGGLATRPIIGSGAGGGGRPPIIPPPLPLPSPTKISPQDAAMFWRRMLTGAMASIRYPLGYGQIIAGNQFFGAFGQTKTGAKAMGAVGLSGSGGATVATAGVMAALLAVTAALKALKETIHAADRARQLYSKALQSGFGTQMTAQRSMIASVMGVSEDDIYKFGAALEYVQPRIREAAKIQAETATVLTPLAYETRILKMDMEASGSKIAVDIAPAMKTFIGLLDDLVKKLTGWIDSFGGKEWQAAGEFAKQHNWRAVRPYIGGPISFETMSGGAIGGNKVGEMFKQFLSNFSGPGGGLGAPQPFMKQLPASAWERMGLVATMHGTGQIDYARRTAIATEKTAQTLQTIHSSVPRGGQPSFDFSPFVANP